MTRWAASLRRLLACAVVLWPTPAAAQFAIYDTFARSFSDVSFFAATGRLAGNPAGISAGRLSSFGIEVLLEIGSVNRLVGQPTMAADTVVLRWTEMRVVNTATGVDTVNTYEVRRLTPVQPVEAIWSFELGVGYAQTTGYRSVSPDLELTGAVRDLPALSLYAAYIPLGTYLGLRSGFMRFHGLQIYDAAGQVYQGDAESLMAGVAIGQFTSLLHLDFFVEANYSLRTFPSIRWSGAPSPILPRQITANSWAIAAGIQFSLGRN
ncbi:hypothetical protein BH23GEM9_BH23GEM9_23660 [soil metagenome]